MSLTTIIDNGGNDVESKGVTSWRQLLLSGASDEVVSFFDSIDTNVQESLLYEAMYLALKDKRVQELLFRLRFEKEERHFGRAMDKFLPMLHEVDLSLVSTKVTIALVEMMEKLNDTKSSEEVEEVSLFQDSEESIEQEEDLEAFQLMADRSLLKSFLTDIPYQVEECINRFSCQEDIDRLLKKTFDGVIKASTRLKHRLPEISAANTLCDIKDILRQVADDEELLADLLDGKKISQSLSPSDIFQVPCMCSTLNTLARECSSCGSSNLGMFACSHCHFVVYCSKDCQVEDWKIIHKFNCQEIVDAFARLGNPDGRHPPAGKNYRFPFLSLLIPPFLTGSPMPSTVTVPIWDLQDDRTRCEAQILFGDKQELLMRIVQDFFKNISRRSKIPTPTMLEKMCVCVLYLRHLRQLPVATEEERAIVEEDFLHISRIPKDWEVSAEDRNDLGKQGLAKVEAGIEWIRENVGEREPLGPFRYYL
jgi:MYND finger